jgi:hypothetical protein
MKEGPVQEPDTLKPDQPPGTGELLTRAVCQRFRHMSGDGGSPPCRVLLDDSHAVDPDEARQCESLVDVLGGRIGLA